MGRSSRKEGRQQSADRQIVADTACLTKGSRKPKHSIKHGSVFKLEKGEEG